MVPVLIMHTQSAQPIAALIPWPQENETNLILSLILTAMAIVVFIIFWKWWQQVEGEDIRLDLRTRNFHIATTQTPPNNPPEQTRVTAVSPLHTDHTETAPVAPVPPDDLTIIEGIGPKLNEILQQAGIHTFADLSAATPESISAILAAAGPRYKLADPSSWPQQAALCAAAQWDALKTMQDSLKGGRHA